MESIKLILELPAGESSDEDFPDQDALPRSGHVGRAVGLNGEQFLQLGVVITAASVEVLRAWLLSRADRLKHARVAWNNTELDGYTPEEIERIVRSLRRELGDAGEEAG